MLVYAKLLHNGAEGAILENFTLKFEYCNDFASFFCFWPKKFPGGAEVPGGCPVMKNFPRGGWHPPAPPGRSGPVVEYYVYYYFENPT